MFNQLDMAPRDPILGLTETFQQDTRPEKVNLSVGVYKDANGKTPVLQSVKRAEERLLKAEATKSYLPMDGSAEYGAAVRELLLGNGHPIVTDGRANTAQTPGGTGGLRVAADFFHRKYPSARLWMSDPTWANHPNVFHAAGIETTNYPYFDAAANQLDYESMRNAFHNIPEGDIVLLHGCCHNPTGADLSIEQWREIGGIVKSRALLPLIDFAYQGFGDGLEQDASGVRAFCEQADNVLVASSFSKNFGLYNERVGALTVIGESSEATAKAHSHIKASIRANYSNPPAHGGGIVATILSDAALRKEWEEELRGMCARIRDMRSLFVDTLKAKGVKRDFSFLIGQRGMFSFSGLTREQVEILREKYAIYIVNSGRINVAGMTESNMDRICSAVAEVLQG